MPSRAAVCLPSLYRGRWKGRQGVKGGGGQEVGSLDVTLKRGQVAVRSPVMAEKCLHHRSGQVSHPAAACMPCKSVVWAAISTPSPSRRAGM